MQVPTLALLKNSVCLATIYQTSSRAAQQRAAPHRGSISIDTNAARCGALLVSRFGLSDTVLAWTMNRSIELTIAASCPIVMRSYRDELVFA